MNPEIFWQLAESYQLGVYGQVDEDILTEEEYLDIEEWVEDLIAEGYDLDDYTDDELYEAYLNSVEEEYRTPKPIRLMKKMGDLRGDSALFKAQSSDPNRTPEMRSALKNVSKKLEKRGDTIQTVWSQHDPEKAKARARMNRNTISVTPIRPQLPETYEVDLYDVISDYLVENNYCNTYEDADVIMANMSEEWREEIINEADIMSVHRNPSKTGRGGMVYMKNPNIIRLQNAAARERQTRKEREKEARNRENAARYDQALRSGINRATNRSEPQEYYAGYGEIEALSPRADGGAHSGRKRLARRASGR